MMQQQNRESDLLSYQVARDEDALHKNNLL